MRRSRRAFVGGLAAAAALTIGLTALANFGAVAREQGITHRESVLHPATRVIE